MANVNDFEEVHACGVCLNKNTRTVNYERVATSTPCHLLHRQTLALLQPKFDQHHQEPSESTTLARKRMAIRTSAEKKDSMPDPAPMSMTATNGQEAH